MAQAPVTGAKRNWFHPLHLLLWRMVACVWLSTVCRGHLITASGNGSSGDLVAEIFISLKVSEDFLLLFFFYLSWSTQKMIRASGIWPLWYWTFLIYTERSVPVLLPEPGWTQGLRQEGHWISKPLPNQTCESVCQWPLKTTAEKDLLNLHQRKQSCLDGTHREAKNTFHEIKGTTTVTVKLLGDVYSGTDLRKEGQASQFVATTQSLMHCARAWCRFVSDS